MAQEVVGGRDGLGLGFEGGGEEKDEEEEGSLTIQASTCGGARLCRGACVWPWLAFARRLAMTRASGGAGSLVSVQEPSDL